MYLDMLLDTGATNVVLPYLIARRLGLTIIGRDKVETAKGKMIVRKTRIPRIQIQRTHLMAENIEAWLDDSQLLGMSFISKFSITLDHGMKMTISR